MTTNGARERMEAAASRVASLEQALSTNSVEREKLPGLIAAAADPEGVGELSRRRAELENLGTDLWSALMASRAGLEGAQREYARLRLPEVVREAAAAEVGLREHFAKALEPIREDAASLAKLHQEIANVGGVAAPEMQMAAGVLQWAFLTVVHGGPVVMVEARKTWTDRSGETLRKYREGQRYAVEPLEAERMIREDLASRVEPVPAGRS